ncbi:Xaa-Pro peptidase family protein [Williamsia sp. CHRR-6]|uniref:M24 family metallopeptidase n=1 Tax=Williamsia sp. CHRR-6 TaxID=2835871 RepID=UPI001BD9C1B3|nr:Xaa-Pro peptidase family protein [Williamsia sp. CHRR-6]MBT0568124.1 aminopeptidase P family protein [Williamsia sp. CHRR-6]
MTDQRFTTAVYSERLARVAELARESDVDAVIVGPGPDLEYLTGSTASTFERLTCLVVPTARAPWVVVPRMELAALRSSAVGDLDLETRDWVDGEDPYTLALKGIGAGVTAVSDALPALHLLPLADRLPVVPQLATPILRRLRMVKDAAEIDALRRAGAAIDRVHARMHEFLAVGRTEREVADDIAAAMIVEGHTRAEFVIVGSGPNGADPHHEVSDRVITANDVVVVDIGGPVAPGYNSDSTRTYCLGDPGPEVVAQIEILQRAQRAAFEMVAPGVTAHAVDAAARDLLTAEGLGDRFIHRTGHGIGLSVHEEPYIVSGGDTVLEAGMAFSIEPGIYLEGRWGARIEDIVVVTADGAESVNRRPHGLTQL